MEVNELYPFAANGPLSAIELPALTLIVVESLIGERLMQRI